MFIRRSSTFITITTYNPHITQRIEYLSTKEEVAGSNPAVGAMKILVTGDRDWSCVEKVVEVLSEFPPLTILVHGACRGADNTCAAVAEALGFEVRGYPADWSGHDRSAGPLRNQKMLTLEHRVEEPINQCLAFHDDIASSKGTANMLSLVKKAGIPYVLHVSKMTT